MVAVRFHGVLPVLVLLSLAVASTGTLAQEDVVQELRFVFAKAEEFHNQGKHEETARYLERALELAPKVLGPDHIDLASILDNLAETYRVMGQYAKAEPICQRSLKIRELRQGADHADVALTLNRLANLYFDMGQYAKAEPLCQRSLKIQETRHGLDHLDVAESLNNLAVLYRSMSQYAKAEPLCQRSLKIRESQLGPDHPEVAHSLNNLADLYSGMGQYAKAEPLHQRSLKIRETKFGPDHLDVADSLNNLAVLYRAMGQYAKTEPLYQRSLKIRETKLGPDHRDVAVSLNNLALLYSDLGQYAKAELFYQRSLNIKEAKLGPDHPAVAASLTNLANLYKAMAQYAKAESLYQRSLKILEARLGPDHPEAAQSLNNLALLYSDMSEYAKAEPLYERSLKILEARLGPDHPDVATSLNNLAVLYKAMGLYGKAEPLIRRGLKIQEAQLGADHIEVANSLNTLAVLYRTLSQDDKAEPLYQRSLRIREAKLGPDHPEVAMSLSNLAILYKVMGQYAKAEPLYQRSLKIREARLGADHPDVADSLEGLALLYWNMGQYVKAEPLHQRSLKIREAQLGPDHPNVAASLHNLASLYWSMDQFAKAEPLYQRSLKIREAKYGPDHPDVAASLINLASLNLSTGQYAKAEPLYQRSLKIQEAKFGADHPGVAPSLQGLAILYKVMGQYAKAEPLYQRSLKINETKFGADHPDVAMSLSNLVLFDASRKRWQESAKTTERLRHSVRRHVARVLPILSESEQLTFLQNTDESRLHIAQSLGLVRRDDPALVEQSAGWVVNGKAVAQQALAERALLARETRDPGLAPLSKELANVRRQLATLNLAVFQAEQAEERRRQIERLNEQEQELAKKLGQAGGHMVRGDPWIELNEVRKALPADTVLIEISKFNVVNFEAKPEKKNWWLGNRYAAWIIFPAEKASRERERPEFSSVRLVDLGEAAKIEDAVQAVRQALLEAQTPDKSKNPILQKGEPEAEKELRKPLAELSKLILEPLLEHIGPKQHWLISPDAALWLVPWAALPIKSPSPPASGGEGRGEGGRNPAPEQKSLRGDLTPSPSSPLPRSGGEGSSVKYAIEKYRISYLVSGRDLVTPPAKTTPGRSMIVADPDYDLGLAAARAAARALLDNPETVAELRGVTSSSKLPQVARLPGTAAEAAAIKPKLARFAGAEPWVYKDKNAQEAVFKSFKSPKVLVLSTHGFFLEDQQLAAPDQNLPSGRREPAERPSKSPLLTKDGKLFENPLVRCGLLLAGCNDREGGRAENDEDGVLTGLEIVGTDLRGTELVVLSACETGLGQVRNGEGVAGLRQAFQLAGARAVVATLWQIPDRDSALLMSEFFENLAAGKSKADALREAQLARIKARRERNGAAHPFFWAAFTLTGE